jgi:hypothetical protein
MSRVYYKKVKRKLYQRDLHRHLMEQHLGRKLGSDEVVHHINGDILDNRVENLQLMTRSQHSRLHGRGRPLNEKARAKTIERHAKNRDASDPGIKTQSKYSDELVKTVYNLRHINGLSYDAIKKITGLSQKATIRDMANGRCACFARVLGIPYTRVYKNSGTRSWSL